jgi:hypothetical protein
MSKTVPSIQLRKCRSDIESQIDMSTTIIYFVGQLSAVYRVSFKYVCVVHAFYAQLKNQRGVVANLLASKSSSGGSSFAY